MPKLNLDDIAGASSGKDFGEFQKNFQEIIANLQVRQKFGGIQTDREYTLDEDGYIVGDVWTEKIASEIMDLNGFQATTQRLDMLLEAREIFGKASVPIDHKVVAKTMGVTTSQFLKMYPKYPIIYFTRWGGLRKPFDLDELRANPVRN
jgi:sulfur relay (sulfurtransferase) DsrC/TusE family protein|tara:strand:- start:872 stop:1318 length:447 start_codon:yes stop_codon:yes gene_type:complete